MLVGSHRSSKSQSSLAKSKVRRAAFHRCMSAASPRDATSLRGVLRVLRKWGLVWSSAASLLARACALHLLCRDAGFLHDAGIMLLAGLVVRLALLLRLCVCVPCELVWLIPHTEFFLHLLRRVLTGVLHKTGYLHKHDGACAADLLLSALHQRCDSAKGLQGNLCQ